MQAKLLEHALPLLRLLEKSFSNSAPNGRQGVLSICPKESFALALSTGNRLVDFKTAKGLQGGIRIRKPFTHSTANETSSRAQ
jgi:hypothetical protein